MKIKFLFTENNAIIIKKIFIEEHYMLTENYPIPTRVDYVPSPYEPDEDGVLDVGYYIGSLSDGRAYRLECWQMDDMVMVTIMFSNFGLTAYNKQDMFYLLELENILAFTTEQKKMQCNQTFDDVDNKVWALNIMLKNRKAEYARLQLNLKRYK